MPRKPYLEESQKVSVVEEKKDLDTVATQAIGDMDGETIMSFHRFIVSNNPNVPEIVLKVIQDKYGKEFHTKLEWVALIEKIIKDRTGRE